MSKKPKTDDLQDDELEDMFDLTDDEFEDEEDNFDDESEAEEEPVAAKKASSKKVAKKAPVKAAKPAKKAPKAKRAKAAPSEVFAVRLPSDTIKQVKDSGVDIAKAFKAFCEEKIIKNKTCPTCGHKMDK